MLRTETTDGVLTVTLARPERRNAIDGEMAAALREAFEAAADDAGRPRADPHRRGQRVLAPAATSRASSATGTRASSATTRTG